MGAAQVLQNLLVHSARDFDWRNEAENSTAANAALGSVCRAENAGSWVYLDRLAC
jgi:hypothetical protein